jgi:hypothetical protein
VITVTRSGIATSGRGYAQDYPRERGQELGLCYRDCYREKQGKRGQELGLCHRGCYRGKRCQELGLCYRDCYRGQRGQEDGDCHRGEDVRVGGTQDELERDWATEHRYPEDKAAVGQSA